MKTALTRDLASLVDVFLAVHATDEPEVVWVGEVSYVHKHEFLGLTVKTKKPFKKVRLGGWRVRNITGRTWILEDGGIAVQTGPHGPDLSVAVGQILTKKLAVQYVTLNESIDYGYMERLVAALRPS